VSIGGNQRSGYCSPCKLCHCSRCGGDKPAERVSRWCAACDRAWREQYYPQAGRRCYTCGSLLPAGLRSCLCVACRRDEHHLRRQARLVEKEKRCRDCQTPLPANRLSPRCTDCNRAFVINRRLQKPACYCAWCGVMIPRDRITSYCRNCACLKSNHYYAYRKGDLAARAARPIKERKKKEQEP
jgi:hypothetical protein